MEKRGVIEPGRTPAESSDDQVKQASRSLEDHVTTRLAKQASDSLRKEPKERDE